MLTDLQKFYAASGLPEPSWHIGPEHPALENLAIAILDPMPQKRVLEIGVQAGGFAVPLITAFAARPEFQYVGVDNLDYPNAVSPDLIRSFLLGRGITADASFVTTDSTRFVKTVPPRRFDLVLFDTTSRCMRAISSSSCRGAP